MNHRIRNLSPFCTILALSMAIHVLQAETAQAQENAVSISVTAEVSATGINMITLQTLQPALAEAVNNIITIIPTESARAGKMLAEGDPGSGIRIQFLPTRVLTREDGPETLTFTYYVAGNSVDDQETAELLDDENRNFTFNENGEFYFWIGGQVDVSTAVPGRYQGEFTIEVEYI